MNFEYDCARCEKRWNIPRGPGISCTVLHPPGTCCHMGETEVNTNRLDFDDWLAYGVSHGFCSEQVCANHAGIPMVDDEMDSEDPDFCIHVVRLGNEDDWQREIDGFNQLATEGR